MTQTEVLRLALRALRVTWYHVGTFAPTDEAIELYDEAITSIEAALANEALERKAENARELGLDYEPEQEPCGGCGGSGWVPRDPDIGTDQECFVCGGSGVIKPEHEPVAWMHTKIDGVVVPHRPADLNRHPDRWTALYKDPKPCPTCEALARTVMLDQTSHDATPPQRKPLTEQEICAILEDTNAFGTRLYTFARAIEAAHGIKG